MAVHDLAALTFPDAARLAAGRAVAILPTGAIEAHGPHLPLGTDIVIAEAMARAGAARLSAAGVDAILLPPLAFTPAPFAAAFACTIDAPALAFTSLVTRIAEDLARHGVRLTAIANAHHDPANVAALRAAVAELDTRLREDATAGQARLREDASASAHGAAADESEEQAAGAARLIFPDLTRRRWAERLTEEFITGACHAGRYETSIMLAARPDLVRAEVMRTLEPNPRSLVDAIRAGQTTFAAAGGADAYFGWPADASAGEGRDIIDRLGRILYDAVVEAL